MDDGSEREVAAEYLVADLEPRRLSPLRMLGAVALVALGDGTDLRRFTLVVRRIDSGAEVLRTPADVGDPEILLEQVRLDLETKTVAEFVAEWRLPETH